MNIVEIKNLSFNYEEKVIFDNLNICVEEGSFTTILGASSSGKTTLAKLLMNNKDYENNILFKPGITTYFIDDNLKSNLKNDSVINNIKNIDDFEILYNEINKIINIESILNLNINTLSASQLQKVRLFKSLLFNPNILIIDNGFDFLKENEKTKIIKYLKKSDITVLNLTKDSNISLLGDYVLIIGKESKLDKVKNIINNDKLLKKNNIDLPFIVDVSKKLNYYNLIDKVYYTTRGLVNKIWK